MLFSVFCGTSLDGFIARRDGTFDFLSAGGDGPHGFEEFYSTIDTVVIGRGTFEVVRNMGGWFYGKKRVVALSHKALDFSSIKNGRVEQMSGSPQEIVERLAGTGANSVYVDGGVTIQSFLRAGLIDRIIVTRVPVLIGDGIPLFGPVDQDIRLRHVKTTEFPRGLVQSEYEVLK